MNIWVHKHNKIIQKHSQKQLSYNFQKLAMFVF